MQAIRLRAWLEFALGRFDFGYRRLLARKGAVANPGPINFASNPRVLKRRSEWEAATETLRAAGLHSHPDAQKNWDALAALAFILEHTSPRDGVLDAGGEGYSPLVEWLFLFGYRDLHVINLSFARRFSRGPIRYIPGNCIMAVEGEEAVRITPTRPQPMCRRRTATISATASRRSRTGQPLVNCCQG